MQDPTDRVLLSPNCYRGWPTGQPTNIFIHTEEGYDDSSISLLRSPASEASAHWCINRDGRITQLVWERDRAWHVGVCNDYGFGIEHEGSSYPDQTEVPCFWTTPRDAKRLKRNDKMLRASARLVAYLCIKYGIPVQHDFRLPPRRDTVSHIAGHDQAYGNIHTDPGPQFPWKAYMRRVHYLVKKHS